MSGPVRRFFSKMTPVAQEEVAWLGGAIKLRLAVYLTDEMPPLEYVTSVRAVVVADAGCAVLRNADGVHVLPGGRREANEEILETLCREIWEETRCSVALAQPFGLLHFHHLTDKPADYAYPYPDFVQAVFAARGAPEKSGGDPDQYEASIEFVVPAKLGALGLPDYQLLLVSSALQLLG